MCTEGVSTCTYVGGSIVERGLANSTDIFGSVSAGGELASLPYYSVKDDASQNVLVWDTVNRVGVGNSSQLAYLLYAARFIRPEHVLNDVFLLTSLFNFPNQRILGLSSPIFSVVDGVFNTYFVEGLRAQSIGCNDGCVPPGGAGDTGCFNSFYAPLFGVLVLAAVLPIRKLHYIESLALDQDVSWGRKTFLFWTVYVPTACTGMFYTGPGAFPDTSTWVLGVFGFFMPEHSN